MVGNHTILAIRLIACFRQHFLVLHRMTRTRIICGNSAGLDSTPCSTVCTLLQFVIGLAYRFDCSLNAQLLSILDSIRGRENILGNFRCIADMYECSRIISFVHNGMIVNFAVCRSQDSQRGIESDVSCCINSVSCACDFIITLPQNDIASI